MRCRGTLLAACLIAGPAHAQLAWTEVTTLSGKNPALAPAPGGGVHVALADGSVRHVELDSQGNALVDELVPGTDGAASGYGFGPAIAVAAGAVHVAFAKDEGSWMMRGFWVADPGSGWTSPLELQGPTERGYAPSIALDGDGTAHVLFGAATNVPFGVANYYRVSGGAVSSTHPALIEWRADDRTAIVAGPNGAVHALGGYPSPSGHVSVAYSSSGGTTFGTPIELQPPNVGSQRVGQPHAAVDAAGALHLVFGADAVHYATLSGDSVQQTSEVTPAASLAPWHLSIGIARIGLLGDQRVVAWQEHAGDDGPAPVSSAVSSDGQSWSAPQAVADDCGGSEGRNTIDLAASGAAVWLACPKGSGVTVFRGVASATVPCNPAAPFAGASVTPASGSGAAQTFTVRLSHCEGASAFRVTQLRVTKVVDAAEPAVAAGFEGGAFYLDAESCAPGEARTLVSTHGSLDCAASSVTENGNELAVSFALAFDVESFAGERGLFVDAKGGSVTPEPRLGWTEVGSFTVSAPSGTGGSSGGAPPTDRGGVAGGDSGCGCRVPARSRAAGWVVALLGFALLARRRRSAPAAHERERTSHNRQ